MTGEGSKGQGWSKGAEERLRERGWFKGPLERTKTGKRGKNGRNIGTGKEIRDETRDSKGRKSQG